MKYEVRVGADTRSVSIERNAQGELRVAIESPAHDDEGAKVFAAVDSSRNWSRQLFDFVPGRILRHASHSRSWGPRGFLPGPRVSRHRARSPRLERLERAREGTWKKTTGGLQQTHGRQEVVAPMPGKIVRVLVTAGQNVEVGQGLVVVEAMKMQNEIRATKSGQAARLLVREGQTVSAGEPLLVIT